MPKGIPKNGVNKGWIKTGQTLAKGVPCSLQKKQKLRKLNLGKRLSEETKRKIGLASIGNKYNLGRKHLNRKGHRQSDESRLKISVNLSKAKTGIPQFHMRGEKNNHWRGGITPENLRIRKSLDILNWRRSVLERDGYTCQKTGQFGGKLRVHHIKNFSKYPELRFAIDNGITLSDISHRQFHRIYGIKNNDIEQLKEFLGN